MFHPLRLCLVFELVRGLIRCHLFLLVMASWSKGALLSAAHRPPDFLLREKFEVI